MHVCVGVGVCVCQAGIGDGPAIHRYLKVKLDTKDLPPLPQVRPALSPSLVSLARAPTPGAGSHQ